MEKWEQSHVTYCKKCKKYAYPSPQHPMMWEDCGLCGYKLEDTGMNSSQLIASQPSREQLFMEAMRKLKDTDPVKYEIAMEKYKQKMTTEQKDKEMLHCPKCGSTAVTAGQRGFNILTGFIGSGATVNRCAKCGYKWKP
ncbi:MAG: hypothetical protein RR198_07600 [Oscillospiraceae bacterium]